MKKIILISLLFLTACSQSKVKTIESSQKVTEYTQRSGSDNTFLYWYIIWSATNNGSCYYYSSPSPVTNISSVTYTYSEKPPVEQEELQETGTQEVPEIEVQENNESGNAINAQEDEDNDNSNVTTPDNNTEDGNSGDDGSSGGDAGGGDGGGGGE